MKRLDFGGWVQFCTEPVFDFNGFLVFYLCGAIA